MSLTLEQLMACMPGASLTNAALYAQPLNSALKAFNLTSLNNRRMFLATIAEETGELSRMDENLNYSAEALVRTWPTRFKTVAAAQPYHRNPQKIANKVYALRMGNGDEASGDGWRYRGAGLIQLTGKANQSACAFYFKKRVEDMPEWLRTPEGACMSAAWYWTTRGCSTFADHNDFDGVCDIVNIGKKTSAKGDAINYISRLHHLRRIQTVIKE